MSSNPYSAPDTAAAQVPSLDDGRPRRRWPGRVTRWGVIVFVALSILVLVTAPASDRAISRVGFILFNFIATCWLLAWFVFRSSYAWWLRAAAGGSFVLALVALPVCFTIVGWSGTLRPVFRWRWAPPPDHMLTRSDSLSPTANRIDLATETENDFPQFLGPNRNAALEGYDLARDWESEPPRLVWRQKIGAGWSAFSAVNGYAVTLEQRKNEELVTCYEIATGKLVWMQAEQTRHETSLGGVGPRSTPTIDRGKVYALGATGRLRCLDGATGAVVWKKDLYSEYGTSQEEDLKVVAWGRSSSPLVVDDLVVVPAGGRQGGKIVSLVAYHRETGDKVWEAGDTQIAYASPAVATIGGVTQILSLNESNLTSHDPQTGKILWTHSWPGDSTAAANNSQPQLIDGNRILLSKAYAVGCALVEVTRSEAGEWATSQKWRNSRALKTKFTNVAVVDQCAYGLSDGILECVDLNNGHSLWKKGRYEHGQLLAVDDLLLIMSEDGDLLLVEANPLAHSELCRIHALDGQTWNNLCLYGKLLLVRNGEEAACYELP